MVSATGRVTALAVNVRSAAMGAIVGMLRQNVAVSILDSQAGWLQISAVQDGKPVSGWVSAAFVAREALSPSAAIVTAMPPADDASHPVKVAGGKVMSPDGQVFAVSQTYQGFSGFFARGATKLQAWLAAQPLPPALSPSVVRVLAAVAQNEALLEGINSYDAAFLSFGMQQWTLGTANNAGELPALLSKIKATDAPTFEECFGRYGLSVALAPATPGWVQTGFLVHSGNKVGSEADKAVFRTADWAYRFWRAGHAQVVRSSQASLAAERIALAAARTAGDHRAGAWLTSEQGMALLLDEHVNMPAHVAGTLETALRSLGGEVGDDPDAWTDDDEARLIQAYTQARNETRMNNPDGRARRIAQSVLDGELSAQRGSFKA